MPILKRDANPEELAPGAVRYELVSGKQGSDSLTVAEVVLAPGGKVPVHFHPTEEAMVILDGELEAVLGDQDITVKADQTVLAPAGVKHGFSNNSGASASVMAIFPTVKIERTLVDE